MANPIDKLMCYDCLKEEVDARYKQAKMDAEDYLASLRDSVGTTALTSPMFGPEAGEFKYGKSRGKKAVEFNVADEDALLMWLVLNPDAAKTYVLANAADFAEKWLADTGEMPDGISRAEYEIPSTTTPPKIYRQDRSVVRDKMLSSGGFFDGADRLLLEDPDGRD